MPDPTTPDAQPDLFVQGLGLMVRHGMTLIAGFLGTHGLLAADQQTQFISIGASVVMAGAAMGWSYVQKHNATKALTTAVKS